MNGDKISTPQMLLRYQHLPIGKQRTVPFEAIPNNSGKNTGIELVKILYLTYISPSQISLK